MIVCDTNVVSELMRADADQRVCDWADSQPRRSIWISSVSMLEIRYGLLILPAGRRRSELTSAFEAFLAADLEGRVLDFDRLAAEETAKLISDHRRSGRGFERSDAMIAGTVRAHGAALATRDIRHFAECGIPLVDPWR